jgi:nucleoside transporter
MMFLQFFVWGAWYVSMTGFFGDQEMDGVIGAAYTIGPIAAIIAPLFLGVIADRIFASQKVLSALHLIGAIAIILAPMTAKGFSLETLATDANWVDIYLLHDLPAFQQPMILLLLLHMLCYMPTLSLTTSISFQHLEDQEKEFPYVRVFGTIGWIVGNISISFLAGKDASATQFYLAGGAGLLLAGFSMTLPNTPPPNKGKSTSIGQILGVDSLKLFKDRNYSIFMLCSFLLCIPLAGYYAYARSYVDSSEVLINGSATFTMSLGQMSEIFFMVIMPLMFMRLGVKWMLVAGMGAWVLRYALFSMGADDNVAWMIIFGVLLHGICYDFFFVTGMVYVDKKAPEEIRNQAQGFLVLVTQGLGLGIGAKLFAAHATVNTVDGNADWETIWKYPAILALIILVIFVVLFNDKTSKVATTDGTTEGNNPDADPYQTASQAIEPVAAEGEACSVDGDCDTGGG